MTTIDTKALAEQLKSASDSIKGEIGTLRSDFEKLDGIVSGIQAKGKRMKADTTEEVATDPEFSSFLTKGISPMETKELSVTNDGQGVSVRSQWSASIFKLVRETSPVRDVANVISTNSNEIEVLVDRDEPASDWIGELGDRDPTAASFMTRHKIAVHEHYAYPSITLQMLEDSQFNVENWLQNKLVTRFGRQEAAAFISGDGIGKPRGILNYSVVDDDAFTWPANPDNYEIGALYSGVAGDLSNADILCDLVDSLKVAYLSGAGFMMTRAMRNKIRKLKDNEDRYLLQPSLTAGVPDRLLGYPVYLAEDMPTLAADAVGILFGNFQQAYTIVDRTGITIQRDAVTKPGWNKYYCRRRVGGALTNPEAVKALVLGLQPQ